MFDSLVKDNNIFLKEKDERFIKALIAGEPGRCEYVTFELLKLHSSNSCEARMKSPFCLTLSRTKETGWMSTSTLICAYSRDSNANTSCRFDYILRDSHMVGDPMSIALPRHVYYFAHTPS